MISIRRLALMAIAATAVASPALAQSFDPSVGTRNIVPLSVWHETATVQQIKVAAHQVRRHYIAGPQSGLSAFGAVPGNVGGNSLDPALDPALTGGGSAGYNDFIRKEW